MCPLYKFTYNSWIHNNMYCKTVKVWNLGVINNQLHMALVSLIQSFMQRWVSRVSHFRLVSVLDRNDNKCGPKALWSHNPSTTKKHSNKERIINKQRNENKSGPKGPWSLSPSTTKKHSNKEILFNKQRNENKSGPKGPWSLNPSTTKKHSNKENVINKQRNENKSGPVALWSHTPAQQQKHPSKEEYHQEIKVAPRYKLLILLKQLTPRAYTAYTASEKKGLLCL